MWEVHVFYGDGASPPLEVTTVQVGDVRLPDLEWVPPENPGWGKRGGVYYYVWFQDALLEVPGLVGYERRFAEVLVQDLNVVISRKFPPGPDFWPTDMVFTQDIPQGTLVAQGTTITLEVAR